MKSTKPHSTDRIRPYPKCSSSLHASRPIVIPRNPCAQRLAVSATDSAFHAYWRVFSVFLATLSLNVPCTCTPIAYVCMFVQLLWSDVCYSFVNVAQLHFCCAAMVR